MTTEPRREQGIHAARLRVARGNQNRPADATGDVPRRLRDWQHFNAKYGGEAWPGYQTIADATGVSKRTVIRMVRLLVAGGYLKVERGSAGRGQSNRYWMTAPKG